MNKLLLTSRPTPGTQPGNKLSMGPRCALRVLAFAGASLALAASVQAQGTPPSSGSGYSMYGPGSTYFGLNAGRSNFRLNNGVGGFSAQQRDSSYSLYGGGYFSPYLGAELGYTAFGRINRAGGTTAAEGFNVSLVGKAPLSQSFNLLGRLGTTYGRTDVSSNALSGIAPGKASGFGLSYGVGAEFAFNPTWSAVLQYDEYNLKFVNTGRDKVTSTSVGVRYRF